MENHWTESSRIIVTCKKRLALYLKQEVESLGFTVDRMFSTGVEMTGTLKDCIRLNLYLRCASQVLFSLKRFRSTRPDDVYDTLIKFPWEKIVPKDGYISVTSTVDHFTVNNNMFVNVKVKDAITDKLRRETSVRPDSGPELDHSVINLFWKEEIAEVFIDTSGRTLAKHGYRKIPGKAPMLEALASATIMATEWNPTTPFINPMCGSGTIAIETVLMATRRYPGLYRNNYGFMHLLGYDDTLYQQEHLRMKSEITAVPNLNVWATDNREDAIDISKINAEAAGIYDLIHFAICDFEETEIPEAPGTIFFNPEYGERMGEEEELVPLYARMGDFMKKKCQGYKGYIFTGNPDLAKKIGLQTKRRIEFYNANLDCRLLEYELYGGSRRKDKPDVTALPA